MRIVNKGSKFNWKMCYAEALKGLYDEERALIEVLINDRGFTLYELLKDDKSLLEDLQEDYKVYDEDEKKEAIEQYYQDLFDDMGLEAFSQNWVDNNIDRFVDMEVFDDVMRESFEAYVYNLNEYELEDEFEQYGVNDRYDLLEAMIDNESSSTEWFESCYGNYEFNILARNHVDVSKMLSLLIEDCDDDGILASYDNIEHEVVVAGNLLFIYRNN